MTDTRTVIGIDIDDVLADTHLTTRLWANKVSGVELTDEHYSGVGDYWGYYERIWEAHDLQDVLNHDDFETDIAEDRVSIPLLAGASFAVKELQKKYKVVLITSRYIGLEDITRRWIAEHFDDQLEIYFAKNDRSDQTAKSKGELSIELGVSYLIDDSVGHCTSALEHGIQAILFGDKGWQHSVPDGIVRCADWPAVLEYFDGRAQ